MNDTLFYMNCFPEQMNDTFFKIKFYEMHPKFRILASKNGL